MPLETPCGIGVLAIYLQKQRKGRRAGTIQMIADCGILAFGLLVVPLDKVLLSILNTLGAEPRDRGQSPAGPVLSF